MDYSLPGSPVHGTFQAIYWSGLPCPPAGHLPDPGIKPMSPALAGGFFTAEPPQKPSDRLYRCFKKSNPMTLNPECASESPSKLVETHTAESPPLSL